MLTDSKLETIFTAVPENGYLEAEISRKETGELIARLHEDDEGWHLCQEGQGKEIPDSYLETIKTAMSRYPNRRGENIPAEIRTRGELSLWLMERE